MHRHYLRYPDVHGAEIVFVADQDLWLAPLSGGRAWRLTHDFAVCTRPRFSPDGTKIAWQSAKDGPGDVYVLDRGTGSTRRLTFQNAGVSLARVAGWADDEHVIAVCLEDGCTSQDARLRLLGLDGSSQRLELGTAMGLARHASGAVAVNTPNWPDSAGWKRYRGGTASKIWLDPSGNGDWRRVLPDDDAGKYSIGFFGDRLFFSADIGELADLPQAQLWSVDLSGADLRQHTHHDQGLGYVRDPVTDAATIVYHAHGMLYAMAGLDAAPQPIDVELPLTHSVHSCDVADISALLPDSHANGSLLEWHGGIFYLTHRAGPARALCDVAGVRARELTILPQGTVDKAVFVRDDANTDHLWTVGIDGSHPVQLGTQNLGYVVDLVASPDGSKLGVISHDGRVSLVDVASASLRILQETSQGESTDATFSPDSRYLAWRAPLAGEGDRAAIRVCDTRDNSVFDVTSGLFNDSSPAFSADGKYLAFLSDRTFDPVYNTHDFDLSFGDSTRPYLVALRCDEPLPFGPSVDGWPVADPKSAESNSNDKDCACPVCVIETEAIEARTAPIPVPVGNYSHLVAAKDALLWLHEPPTPGSLQTGYVGTEVKAPKPRLERYGLTSRKLDVLVEALDGFEASRDGSHVVYEKDDAFFVAPADHKVDDDDPQLVSVDLTRLRRDVDLRAQWSQMLRETHRLMADNFWRADMDGNDWDAALARYQQLVGWASCRDDLDDITWEMIGELNTGHAYLHSNRGGHGPRQAGRLGADLTRCDDGSYRIDHVIAGEPSDPRASSPLLAPGVGAKTGDLIVAVDGHALTPDNSIGQLLAGSAGKVVELVLARDGARRRVAVVPVASELKLRYHQWVQSRRDYVREHSQGRLGYVHIPDMGPDGWAQFYRDIHQAAACEAVVVDVRFNGGGHTSQLIIEKLARKVLGWDVSRWYPMPLSYPSDGLRGPVVLITNEFAGSDGDIVAAAVQELGLAKVIGERSWGGVIGIDSRYSLVDGTVVTQPRYSFHFNQRGWDVENHGVDPDIVVALTPADWNDRTVDRQLDVAIDYLLEHLALQPALNPPTGLPPARVAGNG